MQTIVVYFDEDVECQRVREYIQENLSDDYQVRYVPASGPFVPSVRFDGSNNPFFFGDTLWKFLRDLKALCGDPQ